MVRIALDPTPFHHTHELLEFPRVVADLGYEWMQLTPHPDFIPFHRRARADDDLVQALKRSVSDAGIGICALQPVLRWSSPDETQRQYAVAHARRVIEIAVELGVQVINTEFSGRPERQEESENSFYRSMEELVPMLEREGITMNFDPHPDDFVEDGLEAMRVLRGINSAQVGFVLVGSHIFHLGGNVEEISTAAGPRLKAVFAADSFDHHRSHGLRYISNPPGNAARVHQHLRIGDGDVDWSGMFAALRRNGFFDREESILVSNVFAEDESADVTSRFQLDRITALIAAADA
ncbi:sugar phosphate isomerase/epimerase family protein [Clavibacter michiganensis]|uniref:Protein iolH n=1 Tax=Clavibacter michiganensis subsp. insidiosus TaxID=33014 RepID=A0A0D5CN66_9MICO|nr:sugar phosphate isomerase/epimerase family protein [Clavibacter michiganensis]AJW80727.1 protein iolH [Clavibacter michiganensis subsp. insidiosus]AWF99925.1 protein iolH [Clavibacter michiganensis subsp. insidiosus]RIJ45097.1 sugar phosphate isomerase/epimerase [Clavibacter michiganensis subsp. insidiosus]